MSIRGNLKFNDVLTFAKTSASNSVHVLVHWNVDMLVLSSLNKLLKQVLAPPEIHTAILLTPAGDLVSFVSHDSRPKDEIRVLVGLSGEVWSETKQDGLGMVDSEVRALCVSFQTKLKSSSQLGRVIVLPVKATDGPDVGEPLLLIAVNATDKVEWGELQMKASVLF